MRLLRWLFGGRVDREAVVEGEFVAFPVLLSRFDNSLHVRFIYSSDPHRQTDTAFLHQCMIQSIEPLKKLWDEEFREFTPFCRRVPASLSPSSPVWIRDFFFPIGDLPRDNGKGNWFFPHWLIDTGNAVGKFAVKPGANPGEQVMQRIGRAKKKNAVLVRTALVQANMTLFEPGEEDLPCQVLFSFDERIQDEQLTEWAMEFGSYKNTEQSDAVLADVADMTTDERFVWYRRRRLPKEIVGRHEVFSADLNIHRPFLPDGYISDDRFIPCLAEPGERGMLEHVRDW